jgi:hypothetical protein
MILSNVSMGNPVGFPIPVAPVAVPLWTLWRLYFLVRGACKLSLSLRSEDIRLALESWVSKASVKWLLETGESWLTVPRVGPESLMGKMSCSSSSGAPS